MTTAITDTEKTPLDNFKARMLERVASEAGEFMPDDLLQQLVKESVQTLLDRGMARSNGYGEKDGWLTRAIQQQAERQVREAVEKLIAEDEGLVRAAVQEALMKAIPDALVRVVTGQLDMKLYTSINDLEDRLRNR